jgi:YegS/Rv2252/BmrU family lipid kinase
MPSPKEIKIAVILNGISFYKETFYKKFLPVLEHHYQVDVFETKSKNDAILLTSKAVETYSYKVILAAGGDGTLHQVMNGIVKGREDQGQLPVLGVIPMGSGNDFAKGARLKTDPKQLLTLLEKFAPKKINIGKISYIDFSGNQSQRYFINVADIGMGPEVVKRVNESGRAFGSAVAYYKSIIATFFTFKPMHVKALSAEWNWEGKLRSLAVANGKYYGHGLCIAPDAIPDDDIFNVFICGDVTVFDFIRHSETMKRGKHIKIPEVSYRETTSIEFSSEESCMIEGDGEILGKLPAKVELIKKKIDFLM